MRVFYFNTYKQHGQKLGSPPAVHMTNVKIASNNGDLVTTEDYCGDVGDDDEEEPNSKQNNEDIDDNFNDYWKVDSAIKPAIRLPVPSFSRLFIIQRVLKHHTSTETEISKLVCNTFKDKEIQNVAECVLSLLLTNGIKHFMCQFYNEDLHSNVIEMIFNKMILKQFEKEYVNITTYNTINNNNNSNNKYQQLVFNTNDLMCLIFGHFNCNFNFNFNMNENEIVSFSLVCSHWLYHTWNPNSMYHCNLSELLYKERKEKSQISRTWQRVIHAKSIIMNLPNLSCTASTSPELVISKLVKMKNIRKIDIEMRLDYPYVSVLGAIMQNCGHKIQCFCLRLCTDSENQYNNTVLSADTFGSDDDHDSDDSDAKLSPLQLPNARFISIDSNVPEKVPIIWSNKCIKLNLKVANINDKWINYVLKYCDCSCIKELNLFESDNGVLLTLPEIFHLNSILNRISMNESIEKLAQKFTGLKRFTIRLGKHKISKNIGLVLFWKYLWNIISKNDTKVRLILDISEYQTYDLLLETLNDDACKIDSIEIMYDERVFYYGGGVGKNNNKIAQVIASARATKLTINVEYGGFVYDSLLSTIGEQLEEQRLPSVEMIEYLQLVQIKLEEVNKFLQISVLNQRKIFVLLDLVGYIEPLNTICTNIFDIFCQRIFSLIVFEQVPANTKIRFKNISESQFNETYFPMYLKYFDKERIFKEYKQPKCNQWCKALQFPHMQFIRGNSVQVHGSPFLKPLFVETIFHVTNVAIQQNDA